MARVRRLWLVASCAALLGLVIDLVGWLGPHLLRAIKETAYSIQFCLVLGLDIDTGCVTVEYQHSPGGVADLYLYPDQSSQRQGTLLQRQAYIGQYQIGFEYPCFYTGGNETTATFTSPPGFSGLYLSILAAICLIAIFVFNVFMAVRLPAQPIVFMPTRSTPQMTPAPVSVRAEARPVPIQPISDNAAEALRKTDENLTKRIIKLATKLENERDARMELEQRLSQTLEIVAASRSQQSPLRRVTRGNAVVPFSRETEDV